MKKLIVKLAISAAFLGSSSYPLNPALSEARVTSFSLVNARTGAAIPGFQTLQKDQSINLSRLGSDVALKANFSSSEDLSVVGKVQFWIDAERIGTDRQSPYLIPLSNIPVDLRKGTHTLRARSYYAGKNARGIGNTLRVPVQFVTSSPWVQSTPTPYATRVPSVTRTPIPQPTNTPSVGGRQLPLIPSLQKWEQNMVQFGKTHCNNLGKSNWDNNLSSTYYDAAWVFWQIADYTGDASWKDCARRAESIYRDSYVLPNSGKIPGYWLFSHGLLQSYLRTGDDKSLLALKQISENGAFAAESTPASYTQKPDTMREAAYNILTFLNLESITGQRRPRLSLLVDQSLGYFDQIFNTENTFIKPFMVGLEAHALISFYEATGDSRIVPALERAMKELRRRAWVPTARAFKYVTFAKDGEMPDPAPDLNMLIAPAYAWLYKMTGKVEYLQMGDEAFIGGVEGSYLPNPKQFNQSYRWSFAYVQWRK